MKFDPYPYQDYAIEKILSGCKPFENGVGLFLEMGLGKTVCALSAIKILKDQGKISKVLIIGTLRVVEDVWPGEVEKWDHLSGLTFSVVTGTAKNRIKSLERKADLYFINRNNVSWLINFLKNWDFDMLVIDELTSFKSHTSGRFKSLRKATPLTKYIVGMTGTPSPKGLMDLWSQSYLLDKGKRLGATITEYRNRYFRPGRGRGYIVYEWIPLANSERYIHGAISDICVSMKSEDWINLPDKINHTIKVNLSKKARMQYNSLEKHRVLEMGSSDIVAGEASVLANKLLQIANGAVYDEFHNVIEIHQEKLDALEEIIEEANDSPIIVFYNYKHDLKRIKERLPYAVELKTSADIKDWNNGEIKVLLAHPASAGYGLNLQKGGHIIVWFGMTWNLEFYLQANARLHRQGQDQVVMVYHIITKDTIDEQVMRVLTSKTKCQDVLMEAIKARMEIVNSRRR